MGAGQGTGKGQGKGVKGGWRVNAFLLLLTGWQAVLLPWSPLILKDAGFSASSVGAFSGGTTMAASVSVVMCLRWMRRSRSGALRRLLLWLMIATATLLQGWGVGFELRHLTQGGAMPSCIRGWVFSPPNPVFFTNVSTSTTTHVSEIVSQHPHNSNKANSTLPSSHPQHNTTHQQHNNTNPHLAANHTTSTTTPSPSTSKTSTLIHITSLLPIKINTTTIPPATNMNITTTVTSIPVHLTVPSTETSNKTSLSNIHDTHKPSPQRPVNQGNFQHHYTHESLIPASNETPQKHKYPQSSNNHHRISEQAENNKKSKFKVNNKNTRPSDRNDGDLTSQDDLKDGDYVYSQDDNEETVEEGDDDYDDTRRLSPYYPTPNRHYSQSSAKVPHLAENILPKVPKTIDFINIPSNILSHNVPVNDIQGLWKSPVQETQAENYLPNPRDRYSSTEKENSEEGNIHSYNEQKILPSSSSRRYHSKQQVIPRKKMHYQSSPRNKGTLNHRAHYNDYDSYKLGSQHSFHRRSRRDLMKTKNISNIYHEKMKGITKKGEVTGGLEKEEYPLEEMKSKIIKVGIAVLLMLGGLAGAGVEAGVAQLWHCFIHGYDESGESEDILQRTITHTFHFSTYGNHKTWTGITSGGWVIAAGLVSILACLIGTGGGGYGGLLGVHVTLAIGALLILLILPIPYGSIDPPKTRRPLSLYLDDEVLREGVRRLSFHIWVFMNGSLAALSLTFSLWLLQEMTTEGWLVGSQAGAVSITLVTESLAHHTQRRLVIRWGLHGLMNVSGVSLVLHYGIMWASTNVGGVVTAHAGLGVAMAFLWVAVKQNALLLATINDQEREAWASWWCWRLGLSVGAAVWGVGLAGTGDRVRPLLVLATIGAAILASSLCVTAVLSRRSSRSRRRVYHTLDLDIANDEIDEDEDASEDDWLVKRARKEGLSL